MQRIYLLCTTGSARRQCRCLKTEFGAVTIISDRLLHDKTGQAGASQVVPRVGKYVRRLEIAQGESS